MKTRDARELLGYAIIAADGPIGEISDLLIDDRTWTVRHVVAEVKTAISGDAILLPPDSLKSVDDDLRSVTVSMSRHGVENCVPFDKDRPVHRQREVDLRASLVRDPYLPVDEPMSRAPGAAARSPGGKPMARVPDPDPGNPHLRSVREIGDYRVKGTGGDEACVDALLVEVGPWAIRSIAVDTGGGTGVLLPPDRVTSVDAKHRTIAIDGPLAELSRTEPS